MTSGARPKVKMNEAINVKRSKTLGPKDVSEEKQLVEVKLNRSDSDAHQAAASIEDRVKSAFTTIHSELVEEVSELRAEQSMLEDNARKILEYKD